MANAKPVGAACDNSVRRRQRAEDSDSPAAKSTDISYEQRTKYCLWKSATIGPRHGIYHISIPSKPRAACPEPACQVYIEPLTTAKLRRRLSKSMKVTSRLGLSIHISAHLPLYPMLGGTRLLLRLTTISVAEESIETRVARCGWDEVMSAVLGSCLRPTGVPIRGLP